MDAKLIRRLCLWSFSATTLIFALALISLFLYRRDQLIEDARRDARSDLYLASNLICDRLEIARTALINTSMPLNSVQSREMVENLLHHNPDIYGTAIAFTPSYAKKLTGNDRYMIYSCRSTADSLHTFQISDTIDKYFYYPRRDWFKYPVEHGGEYWSEPYYDSLTSGVLMVSYSAPVTRPDSTIIGVLLADMTLDRDISRIVHEVDSGTRHRTYMLSRQGHIVFGDTANTSDALVFTRQMPLTGWTVAHVIDKNYLLKPLHKEIFNYTVLFLITVAILCITIYHTISYTTRGAVKRQMRIDAELDVASRIQRGMLPVEATPTAPPSHRHTRIATLMRPAKEVGGDFYNYFVEGDTLYFIIGDVSGKGVPAALIMAIATQLFMVTAPGTARPSDIMDHINRTLSRNNKENMFITAIAGILHMPSGRLSLCNAGHTPPIIVSGSETRLLPLDGSNIPLGVIDTYAYTTVETRLDADCTLVLYTDGVTEAEDPAHRQFGLTRLMDVIRLHSHADAETLSAAIERAIDNFTNQHEQTDDITLLILRQPPATAN